MSTQYDNYPEHLLLQYDEIRSRFASGHNTYVSAGPFPHIVLDDFIGSELADTLIGDLPDLTMDAGQKTSDIPDLFGLSPTIRQLIWELNSSTFIRALEGLTGLANLIPDPSLRGGGIQEEQSGQPPLIQTVPTADNPNRLECRVKLELYLNAGWKDEYEGNLELWNSDLSACVKRIRPTMGRCVILSLHKHSYHGQSRAAICPAGVSKKCITVYYFTLNRSGAALSLVDIQKLAESELPPPQ